MRKYRVCRNVNIVDPSWHPWEVHRPSGDCFTFPTFTAAITFLCLCLRSASRAENHT